MLNRNTNIGREKNKKDLDEMARNEPSHQNLHCLPFGLGFFFIETPVSAGSRRY